MDARTQQIPSIWISPATGDLWALTFGAGLHGRAAHSAFLSPPRKKRIQQIWRHPEMTAPNLWTLLFSLKLSSKNPPNPKFLNYFSSQGFVGPYLGCPALGPICLPACHLLGRETQQLWRHPGMTAPALWILLLSCQSAYSTRRGAAF